jgi:hypothetical protein
MKTTIVIDYKATAEGIERGDGLLTTVASKFGGTRTHSGYWIPGLIRDIAFEFKTDELAEQFEKAAVASWKQLVGDQKKRSGETGRVTRKI